MKKKSIVAIALLLAVTLLFTGAFAQQGKGSGGQQQGQNQQPMGGPTQNMGETQFNQNGPGDPINLNVDAVLEAINRLDDGDVKAELLALLEAYQTAAAGDSFEDERAAMWALHDAMAAAGLQMGDGQQIGGGPMNFSFSVGRAYGRFLDVQKVAEAIAAVEDEEILLNLSALLTAYEDALNQNDPRAVKDALEALMDGLEEAQLEVDSFTGLQLYNALQGVCLDTAAVEAAITALEDKDTVAALLALLEQYKAVVGSGDPQAVQEALTALMSALEAAGITV